MTTQNNIGSCKGCFSLGDDAIVCTLHEMNPADPCPCQMCLVKMICPGHDCEELDDYINWYGGRTNSDR